MTTGYSSPVGGARVSGTAPASFTSGVAAARVDSNVVIEWDFDNDGDFDESVEDITSLVLSAETWYGRDYPSNLTGKSGPGQMRLTLNNDDDRFSFFNTGSPLNADPFSLNVGRMIRARTTTAGAASDISYVGIGAVAVASNASVAPALPTGLAEHDLLVVLAAIRNSGTGTVNTPAGWYPLLTSGNVKVLGKFVGEDPSTETAPTVTFAGGVANATTQAQCFALRGTHRVLREVLATSIAQLNGSAQNIAVPGLVAAATAHMADPDDVTMVVCGWKQDDWTSVAQLSGQLFTEISDSPTVTGDDAGLEIQYRIGGFSGAKTFTGTSLTVTGGAAAISRGLVLAFTPYAGDTDPVLLARDRFGRVDSANLNTAETGQAWTKQVGNGFAVISHFVQVPEPISPTNYLSDIIETVDVGVADCYVQASLPFRAQDSAAGIVARFTDTSNFVVLYEEDNVLVLREVVAGSGTTLDTYALDSWDGMNIGLGVLDQTATAYIGGVAVMSGTTSGTGTGSKAGVYGWYTSNADRRPAVDDFYVWDKLAGPIDGMIWTGWVSEVGGNVAAGELKTVTVDAAGSLSRAPTTYVPAPRIPSPLTPPGIIVGDTMARSAMLHPPGQIGTGSARLGPYGVPDDYALNLIRGVEQAEQGFLHETPEGWVGFQDGDYRDTVSSSAWFTDTPGDGQYGYSAISPYEQRSQIYNRVSARVAPSPPTVSRNLPLDAGFSGYASDLAVTFTQTQPGDLVVAFLVTSMYPGVNWNAPEGWTSHRDVGAGLGMRIYSHICDENLDGTTVTFLSNAIFATGYWFARVYRFENWLGTQSGFVIGDVSTGNNAKAIDHGWEREPSAFVWFQCSVRAGTGGIVVHDTDGRPPPGYPFANFGGVRGVGPPDAEECGYIDTCKIDCTERENPLPANAITNYDIRESVVIAVRGYDGDNTRTNLTTNETIFDGQVITVEDLDSQLDHNFIRSNPDVPALFYTADDARAYALDVLADKADDRPIFSLMFYPSKSAALRTQAIERKVSDRITVTATGNSGLGIEGDFYIESVAHKWSNGTKLWQTTWDLSPVL